MAEAEADQTFRYNVEPFDAARDAKDEGNERIARLRQALPDVKTYTRSSPRFGELRALYSLLQTEQPLAICRPTTETQVSRLVRFCGGEKIPLCVRSGGHDIWGRSSVGDALVLDVRELDSIVVAADRSTATIGGGTMEGNLVDFLDTLGLVASCGVAATVGWTAWALGGGYGPLSDHLGLGVDQVLGARIVTADGEIRQADDELLWAIRGAGTAFGVIVQLTIKIYPMPRMLSGLLAFDFHAAAAVLQAYQALADQGLPAPLGVQFGVTRRPNGLGLMTIFTWSSPDLEQGLAWLDKIKALGPVLMSTVGEASFKKLQDAMSQMLGKPTHIHSRSMFLRGYTPTAVRILLEQAELIPDGTQYAIGTHPCHGVSTKADASSCFGNRDANIMVNAHSSTDDLSVASAAQGKAWVDDLVKKMDESGERAPDRGHVSLMGLTEDFSRCFGGEASWNRLREMKRRFDPENLFRFAQPSTL